MTRSYGALLLAVTAAGCMTDPAEGPEEGTTQQNASGGHFPNAVLPPELPWDGSQPPLVTTTKQSYVLAYDAQSGYYHALLADTGQGKILYASLVPVGKLSGFVASVSVGLKARIDIIRVPPAPPPGGTDWLARYGLEVSLDTYDVSARALGLSF